MKGVLGFIIGGAGGLMLGIIVGVAILGGFSYWQSGGTNIPYDQNHVNIANRFVVRDVTWGKQLTLAHLQTGPIEFSPYSPTSIYFPTHLQTTQSIWAFLSDKDVDIIMLIYGPGNDSKSYLVSFSRVMANEVSIAGWGQTISWPAGDSPAWQIVEIKLP